MRDVFILGAGASIPYGFPDGFNLLRYLQKRAYAEKELYTLYRLAYDGGDTILTAEGIAQKKQIADRWKFLLNNSLILTIDQFLKNHSGDREFYQFGKMAIAQSILQFEYKAEQATNPKNSSIKSIDWIQYLLTELDKSEDWQRILQNTLFITYNYDRVLELFLHRYLTVDKHMEDGEAHQFIEGMDIHHINGYIGPLREVPFGKIDSGKIQIIAESIRTVWDKRVEEDEAAMIKDKLEQAGRVFILGTSFIRKNFELISFTKSNMKMKNKVVIASGYGLSEYQRKRAVKMLGHRSIVGIQENKPECWCVQDMTALDLIKDYYCGY